MIGERNCYLFLSLIHIFAFTVYRLLWNKSIQKMFVCDFKKLWFSQKLVICEV